MTSFECLCLFVSECVSVSFLSSCGFMCLCGCVFCATRCGLTVFFAIALFYCCVYVSVHIFMYDCVFL